MWRIFLCCVGSAFQVLLIVCFYISQAQLSSGERDAALISDSGPWLAELQDARYAQKPGYDFNDLTDLGETGKSGDKLE